MLVVETWHCHVSIFKSGNRPRKGISPRSEECQGMTVITAEEKEGRRVDTPIAQSLQNGCRPLPVSRCRWPSKANQRCQSAPLPTDRTYYTRRYGEQSRKKCRKMDPPFRKGREKGGSAGFLVRH